ncbi:hypothetical protein BLOT_010535 [Blomia tropicalis]|nr:hypothetical protein BLOT_010535 [Blomia tropicalis]
MNRVTLQCTKGKILGEQIFHGWSMLLTECVEQKPLYIICGYAYGGHHLTFSTALFPVLVAPNVTNQIRINYTVHSNRLSRHSIAS